MSLGIAIWRRDINNWCLALSGQREKIPKAAYIASFLSSVGGGFYWPYISIYAVEIGASYSEIGIVTSISNASPMVLQPLWGYLSDKYMRRVIFISVGYIIAGLITLFFISARSPLIYAFLLALSLIALSAVTPTWNSYIGSFFEKKERGRGIGKISGLGIIGSIFSTLFSGYYMTMIIGEKTINQYYFSFTLAGLFLIMTGLISLLLKERSSYNATYNLSEILMSLKNNKLFLTLCLLEAVWSFTLSFPWPMFSAAYIYKLNATKIQIATANVFFNASFALSQIYLGYLVDVHGRKKTLLVTRFIFPMYPLLWFIAQDVSLIYIANTIVGITNAIAMLAVMSYILDITREEERASYFAMYNMVIGFAQFLGSLIGGYLGDYLIRFGGLIFSIQMIFLISVIMRIFSAIPYIALRETIR